MHLRHNQRDVIITHLDRAYITERQRQPQRLLETVGQKALEK